MPTNQQRRQAAKRKLERQLESRQARARRRRIWAVGVVAIALVVAAVAATLWWTLGKKDQASRSAATTAVSATETAAASGTSLPEPPPVTGAPLPPFAAPADLGANCQYPPAGEAARKVDPPKSGHVPTEPAQVTASMKTSQGNIGLVLDNGKAPCTVNSFASLAQKGYFDDTVCHRMTTGGLSVLQCGDPTGTGSGGPGYQFANEYPTNQFPPDDPAAQNPVVYPAGTLAMANAGPGTNGSQFFMVYRDSLLPPQYTVFGTIDKTGMDTLAKIEKNGIADGATDGKPGQEVKIVDVQLD